MNGMRLLLAMLLTSGTAAHAEDRGDRYPTLSVAAFRLTKPDATKDMFRILPDPVSRELMPGDRSSAELCDVPVDRPREPGATMRARMSMRLDTGRNAMRPDFALGGLGAVLVRMTDALVD